MDQTNIFLLASRKQLRFPSAVGPLTVEDLWNIPLRQTTKAKASIEEIGNTLLSEQQKAGSTSIFGSGAKSEAQQRLELQIAILREIIAIREAEAKKAEDTLKAKQEIARIEALIKAKQEQNASVEDLQMTLSRLQQTAAN